MPLNWRPPVEFNLNYGWWRIPKKWQPSTPEGTDEDDLFPARPAAMRRGGIWYDRRSKTVVHYDSKP
eukprot:1572335-Lingulodinium_polyedra.AAC.1